MDVLRQLEHSSCTILKTNIKRFKVDDSEDVACVTIVVLHVAIDTLKVALHQDLTMSNTHSNRGSCG